MTEINRLLFAHDRLRARVRLGGWIVGYVVLLGLLVFLGQALSSCAALVPQRQQEQIARVIKHVCAEPLAERQAVIAETNTLLGGAKLSLWCPGDPAP